MPKSETPATRRSARVAAASAVPKAAPEAKAAATSTSAKSAKGASTKAANGKPASAKKESAESKTSARSSKSGKSDVSAKSAKSDKSDTAANGETGGKEEKTKTKAATNSRGPLKLGQTLPRITLQDNTEEDVDVASLTADGRGVVLFLYPRACGFRDAHDEIAALGYDVYGLSKDKPPAQQKWINKKNLNYKLLCDPQSQLIKKLGAFVQPNKSHFIFEKGSGKLVDIAFRVKPADDPSNVLQFLKAHHKDD